MPLKRVIVNLDEEVHRDFQDHYGKTIGVSKALRLLIEQHMKKIRQRKEQNDESEPK